GLAVVGSLSSAREARADAPDAATIGASATSGTATDAPGTEAPGTEAPGTEASTMEASRLEASAMETSGAELYRRHCAACHGSEGAGGLGPALAGNDALADASFVVGRIVHGGGAMPSFAGRLDDEAIARVASHVRGAWGNDYGEVAPAEVAAIR